MRLLIGMLSFALVAMSVNASPRVQVRKGNEAARTGDGDAAMTHYKRALEQKGDSSVVLYDVGNVLYQVGKYDAAEQAFGGSLSPGESKNEQSATLYNLGNSLFQSQKYDKAVAAYIEALKRNPPDKAAKYNLELAKRMLREQQQQQKQQDKNQEKEDQQKKQDQQEQSKDDQKKDQQQQEQQDQQQKQQQEEERQQAQQGSKQQMSPEEAERLLNALLQNEQNALKDAKKVKVAARAKREKDW